MIDQLRNTIYDVVSEADDETWGTKMNELQTIARDVVINNEDFRNENVRLTKKVERLEDENKKLKTQLAELKAQIADIPSFKVSKVVASKTRATVEA